MNQRRGQSLVESMIAISVLMIGFLAVVTLLNQSLGMSRVVADKTTGAYLAAEGIELTKNWIDSNIQASTTVRWDYGLTGIGGYLDFKPVPNPNDPPGRGLTIVQSSQGFPLCFDPNTGSYFPDDNAGACGSNGDSKFTRSIEVTEPSADEIKVVSKVSWLSRGSAEASTTIEDHFFHWQPH